MQTSAKSKALRNSLIFSGLDDEEITELAGLAMEHTFQAGESIFWDGDDPDWFYLVADGRVKISKHSSLGKEFVIAFFQPGEMFGEVAVFGNKPYPASAHAVSDTTVLRIRREDLSSFISRRPEVALRIINVLGERLRDAQSRLRDIAGERVEQRLARTLLMLSSKLGNTLPFTRQELADMAGTTTETAIRVMSHFKYDGIIRSARGKTIIVDESKLLSLSDGPHDF